VAVANCLGTAWPGIPPSPYRQLLFTSLVSVGNTCLGEGGSNHDAAAVPAAAARFVQDSLSAGWEELSDNGRRLPGNSGRTLMRRRWKIRDQNLLPGTGALECAHVQHEAANTKRCLVRFQRHRTRKFLECGEGPDVPSATFPSCTPSVRGTPALRSYRLFGHR